MSSLHPTSPDSPSPRTSASAKVGSGVAAPGSASLHIIYASTSGHTEYVATLVQGVLEKAGVTVEMQRAEAVQPEDLLRGDVLLLASSTWNTGNVEGQLNPHMYHLLLNRAKAADLRGKMVALVALGDDRYRYTANAAVFLEDFVKTHHGKQLDETLKVVNEPYGQEKMIEEWAVALGQSCMDIGRTSDIGKKKARSPKS